MKWDKMTEQEKDEYIRKINEVVDTGREVMCIDNEDVEQFLTKGKRYKVYSHDISPSIRVISDDGHKYYSFSGERFQSRQDIREEKLKQLGL